MRLVLDTNVVLSALLWRGTPYRLLDALRQSAPTVQLYSSMPLLEELADVLGRAPVVRGGWPSSGPQPGNSSPITPAWWKSWNQR